MRGWSGCQQPLHVVLSMLYMIVERYRDGDPVPVYRRFRERGRLAPPGLVYVSSWITPDLTTCYQVMETPDRSLIDAWITNWSDIVDFEVHPVITSAEAQATVAPRL
jgi:hypothetical protein